MNLAFYRWSAGSEDWKRIGNEWVAVVEDKDTTLPDRFLIHFKGKKLPDPQFVLDNLKNFNPSPIKWEEIKRLERL